MRQLPEDPLDNQPLDGDRVCSTFESDVSTNYDYKKNVRMELGGPLAQQKSWLTSLVKPPRPSSNRSPHETPPVPLLAETIPRGL